MKTKELLSLVFLIFALLTGCDDDKTFSYTNYSNDYFPLNIGDSWVYGELTQKVSTTQNINNKEYMVVLSEIYRADTLFYSREDFYRRVNHKIYKLYEDQSDEFLCLDFSLPENESWSYKTEDNPDQEWKVTVLPNISFQFKNGLEIDDCKRFFFDVEQWADEEYRLTFAPGIGRISTFSTAWGLGDTIQKATINGVEYHFK